MADKTRLLSEIKSDLFDDEQIESRTSIEQVATEELVERMFSVCDSVYAFDPEAPRLYKAKHRAFLAKSLSHLATSYQCLDCSRPWLCYWIVHSMQLLDESFTTEMISSVSDFLSRCQNCDGGFGGGPGQYSHLAPTYAAISALCVLGDEVAYKVVDREQLVNFLWRLKQSNGAFALHEGGEVDIRGVYCALAVARLTNCYTEKLFENSAQWVASCQTYEGGFSGYPGMEAHGGYTFCGLAALVLLNKPALCDVKALLRWAVNRQMRFEGGFQGRSNKLVDGCYSFWQGGVFPIVHNLLAMDNPELLDDQRWLFHQEALQEYILICCQHANGGCLDKPSKERDCYHTCYVLSGLSVAQHSPLPIIVGASENKLGRVHPVFNIGADAARKAAEHFRPLPVPLIPAPCQFTDEQLDS